jgi:hypothetical protein
MARILVFAWEISGAAALAPLLPALAQEGHHLTVMAVKPAFLWFQAEIAGLFPVEEYQSGAADSLDYQVCLAAFGNPRQSFGLRVWMEISADKRSLVVLDNWKGPQRFFHPKGMLRDEAMPTRLAVMDSVMAGLLKDMGLPPEKMAVTGHPQLCACGSGAWFEGHPGPDAARARLGLAPDRPVCLLVSEPIHNHGFYQACTPACRGLFQMDAGGRELWRAVVDEARQQLGDAEFIMRPHPTEKPSADPLKTVTWEQATARDLLAAADRVYGLSSNLVMQAAALGKPTYILDRAVKGWVPDHSFLPVPAWEYLRKTGQLGGPDGARPDTQDHARAITRVVREVDKLLD